MAENLTQPNDADVQVFLSSIENERRRNDAQEICALLTEVTGEPPVLWGASIVGFGVQHYRYASGRQGDWFLIGFSPRKANLVVYFTTELDPELLGRLGKHKRGVGCLYLGKLDDIDRDVLRQLIIASVAAARG